MSAPLRVVAIADADSFVKWSANLLDAVPDIRAHMLIVRTPLTVSAGQEVAALAGTRFGEDAATRLGADELAGWLGGHQPDAVVLAGRGPFVRLVARVIDRLAQRPVVISGLPGMAIPAQRGALEYRRESDLLVVHSRREQRAFAELGRRIGVDVPIALATLPFAEAGERLSSHSLSSSTRSLSSSPRALSSSPRSLSLSKRAAGSLRQAQGTAGAQGTAHAHADRGSSLSLSKRAAGSLRQAQGTAGAQGAAGAQGTDRTSSLSASKRAVRAEHPAAVALAERPESEDLLRPCATDIVFASQALVPGSRADRAALAGILLSAAEADPSRRVVIKLRSRPGEHETHLERDAYADLLPTRPGNLVFSHAPMAVALERAQGLVTVSSTAAVEAVARGIPVIALDTFGVHKELLNTVFVGSGLLGGAEEVVGRRFRHPHPDWLRDNYFHPAAESDWWDRARELIAARGAGLLSPRVVPSGRGGALRAAWHRKSVLGAEDRTLSGAVALGIGAPLVNAMLAVRRSSGRAGEDTWADPTTDFTLEPTPLRDSIRR